VGEAIAAKALHTPAFVVHTNEQVLAHGLDVGTQLGKLLTAGPVATKQNHAASERVRQALAVGVGELGASNVQDEGGVVRHQTYFFSTIT
jgi:hypothetical protein